MCTDYIINDKETDEIPFEFNEVEIRPKLQSFAGWKQSIADAKKYEDLPEALQTYLSAIESQTGVRIMAVSISPDRKDVLFKD